MIEIEQATSLLQEISFNQLPAGQLQLYRVVKVLLS